MSEPWPTPGNVALRMFFMLVIDEFVIYTWSNGPCYTGFWACLTQTPRLMMCTWFHCCCPWVWLPRPVAKQNVSTWPAPTKSLRPCTSRLGFPGQAFHIRPCSSLLEKSALLWPLTTSQKPMLDLSGLHRCKSFSCCFCSVFFVVIRHSGMSYVLLNLESPSGESPNETGNVSIFPNTISLQPLASLAFSRKNLFTTKALKALSKFYWILSQVWGVGRVK